MPLCMRQFPPGSDKTALQDHRARSEGGRAKKKKNGKKLKGGESAYSHAINTQGPVTKRLGYVLAAQVPATLRKN